ncbi:MAG: hypothetical protein MK186_02150 [Henriciella sp.]|nr:hypothetical protein [Henriciella sp.]
MDSFTDQCEAVAGRYFSIWKKHDTEALSTVFPERFSYYTNGKLKHNNLSSLRTYWRSIKADQEGVLCTFKLAETREQEREFDVIYKAHFFRRSLWINTSLTGQATFKLNEDGFVDRFTEIFIEDEELNVPKAIKVAIAEWLASILRITRRYAAGMLNWLSVSATGVLIAAYLLLVVFAAYLNFFENDYHYLFRDNQALANSWVWVTNACFALGSIALAFRHFFLPSPNDLVRRRIAAQPRDGWSLLTTLVEGAEKVTILSGDFSFVSSFPPLASKLYDLAARKKLTLVTSVNKEELFLASAQSAEHRDLLRMLDDQHNLIEGGAYTIKLVLIERRGEEILHYMYDDRGKTYFATISTRNAASVSLIGETRKLVQTLIEKS